MTSSSANNIETGRHQWDVTGYVPNKPSATEYGFVVRGDAIGCTREELVKALVARGPDQIRLAWTPDTPEPVFPEKIPLLTDAFRRIVVRQARNSIWWGLGMLGFGIALALILLDWRLLYLNFLSVFGALFLIEGLWIIWRSRHYDLEDAESDASSLRFDAWIKNKQISGFTFVLGAWIVIVGGTQVLVGVDDSIKLAGLVKPAVWQGQWWRLLTACLMHVNFMHFWMNFLALLHFSRIIERTVNRAYIPIIFLFAGALGSVFSVLLYPNTTSIGASGGLMGLLGFITAVAYFDRSRFPPKYLRRSLEGIVLIGLFGLIGFAFIDNAAHLGGLCGGLFLGWLFRPVNPKGEIRGINQRSTLLGVTSVVLLGLVAAIAVLKMLRYR